MMPPKTRRDYEVFKLGDRGLERLLGEANAEMRRRVRVAAGGDAGKEVRGQEMAKRALVVAVAGGHSICFVGCPGTGKTMLRGVGHRLGLDRTYEVWPCPCGYHDNPVRTCSCSVKGIGVHRGGWPQTEIMVETPTVPERDMAGRLVGTSEADMRRQVEGVGPEVPEGLDEYCKILLKAAVTEMGLSGHDREAIVRVSRTIARLDRTAEIHTSHLVEAINYRAFK